MPNPCFHRIEISKAGLTATIALLCLFNSAIGQESPSASSNARKAEAILQRALQHANWFNWADAAPDFQQAEQLLIENRDRRNALLARIGVLRSTMEDHSLPEVREQLVQIANAPAVKSDPELLLFASIAKADVDGELNAEDAREDWRRIEQLARSQNKQEWANRSLGEQSFSEFLVGNISKGRVLIATALGTAQKTNDVGGQIRYLTGIGAALDQAHRYDQALEYLTKASDLVRSHPEAGYAFVTNEYRIEALVGLKNLLEAEALAKSVIGEAGRRHRRVKEAQALITLARIEQQTNRPDEAVKTLSAAERLTSGGNFTRLSADIQFVLADFYLERGRNRIAEDHLSRGLLISQRTPEIWLLPARIESLAELKVADGKYREADALYHRASDIVDTLIGGTTNSQAERSLIAANSEIFVKHFQLCVDHLGDGDDAYRGLEEARGRTSLDMLRGAFFASSRKGIAIDQAVSRLRQHLVQASNENKRLELKNAIFDTEQQRWTTDTQAGGNGPRVAEIVPVRRVQARLAPDEAVVEYVVGERRIYCLVLRDKSVKIVRLGQRAAVEEKIDAFLSDIASKKAKSENGRALFTMLLEPLPGLDKTSHLIVIRDGKLHLLPWDALVDRSNRYLVETKNISYAPSVSSAILLRDKAPVRAVKKLLGVGGIPYDQSGVLFASTRGSYPPQKLGNLPDSADEVRDAARLLRAPETQVDLQLGQDGTKKAFERAIRERHSVVHLAVHALADSKNPDHAALFLLNDKGSGTDGMLDSAEVLTLPVRANVVVLSACETAVGRLEGQEGIETLSRAFLLAGARTVVSTLWTIDDTFSRFLIAQFYTALAEGQTTSVALRNAKLKLLKTFGPKAVPYRWAAYTLEGADNSVVPVGS